VVPPVIPPYITANVLVKKGSVSGMEGEWWWWWMVRSGKRESERASGGAKAIRSNFRPLLREKNIHLPTLTIFGPRGSGPNGRFVGGMEK